MAPFKSSPIRVTIIALCLLALLATTASRLSLDTTKVFDFHARSLKSGIERVRNATLGFEKVFVVGLPERSDKRDALALTSSLTGIKLDWIDGVRGESVPDKAVPYGADRMALWENNLGSWRGHMNAVRRIVEDGIATALIMEDDMDWDVRLKSQLQQFATGARYIQSASFNATASITTPPHSPYGNTWDLLWLGHCGEVFPETLPENHPTSSTSPAKFTLHPDATVPFPTHLTGFQNFSASPSTRWIHVTGAPICTFAYALSHAGAQKVLYDLSVDHLLGPFDNALANLCRYGRGEVEGGLGMRCVSVTPPLFFHHKPRGTGVGDSDIQGGEEEEDDEEEGMVREKGETQNIAVSARNNVRNLMLGLELERQFED